MPFLNPITTLTIPENAGPNDPQLVITSVLPPPLDTYEPLGANSRYVGGILWFAQGPADDNFDFQCMAVQPATPTAVRIDLGSVRGGAVAETIFGGPAVQRWESLNASGDENYRFFGDRVTNELSEEFNAIVGLSGTQLIMGDSTVDLTVGIGGVISIGGIGGVETGTVDIDSDVVTIDTAADVNVSAGDDVSITATDDITISAGDDLSLIGTDISLNGGVTVAGSLTLNGNRLSGANEFLGQGGANGNTSSTSFADYPGTQEVTLTKTEASTAVMVMWSPTFFVDNVGTGVEFAVRVNGAGTEHVTHRVPANQPAANARLSSFGMVKITGLAAGNHSIRGRWRRFDGANTISTTTNDYSNLFAWEVSA